MLKFVVTKKSNRSSLKKQLRRVAKSLTPTKKVDKTSKGMDPLLDPPVIQKFHPLPPTSLVDDVTRKRENAVDEYEEVFQSPKEKTGNLFEEERKTMSSKRSVTKTVSFKDPYLYVRRSSENDAWNISPKNTDRYFSRNIKSQSRRININRKIVNSCLNVSQLPNDLNVDRVSRSNSLNISQFNVDSSLGELSFHMQLYDDQLKRIKHKTEKLRERDTVIREKFEAVRRKAKQLKIIDDDFMYKTFQCKADVLIPSQLPRKKCNEDESVMNKPKDDTSVFDSSVCVTRNKSLKISGGLSYVARKKHLLRSFNSPKRLKRAVQKLPRLTSPLARGAKEKFSSTRDVILCALSKDNRKFTFC